MMVPAWDRNQGTTSNPKNATKRDTPAVIATDVTTAVPRSLSGLGPIVTAVGRVMLSYRSPRSLPFGPAAQQAPDHDQLPEVVGVVVGGQQRFPPDGLPVAVRDRGE